MNTKYLAMSVIAASAVTATGCRSHREVNETVREAVAVEDTYRIQSVHRERIDTVETVLPAYSESVTAFDSVSLIRTPLGTSRVKLLPDGSIYHSLHTGGVPVRVPVAVSSDTLREESIHEVPVKIESRRTETVNEKEPRSLWLPALCIVMILTAGSMCFRRR